MKAFQVFFILSSILYINLKHVTACPVDCSCLGTQVDCSGNGLTAIPSDIEVTTTNLDLSDNSITTIGSSLSNLLRLEILNLNNNSILIVDDNSFVNLTNLKTLDLGSNQLSMLSSQAFSAFTQLKSLNLTDNQLEILPNGLFNKTYQLQTLRVAHNRLTDISLRVINTVYLALLQNLYLTGNIFPSLPYLAFNNLASLLDLFIIECSIETIDSNAFVGLNKLQILDVSLNHMTSFRREMFQSIPQVSQLGIYGNPIACSCSIKQVQDFMNDNTVTLLFATNCSASDGSTKNIGHEDLSSFCPDPTTPSGTVAPWCTENTTLSLTILQVDRDSAEFKWDIQHGNPPEAGLHLHVRKASQDNQDEYDIRINTPPDTPISVMLEEASPYIACIYQTDCKLRTCINFATDGYGDSGPLSLEAAVGVTSGSFALIIIILVVAFLVGLRMKSASSKSHDVEELHHTVGPGKDQTYMNDDPYEHIPPDSPIAKMPKHRHANDALPQPGFDLVAASTLPTKVAPKQRPVTAGSHTLGRKTDHSPNKHDRPEQILTGSQTQVFRRPNTFGSQDMLCDVPGLPPKSAFLSKSQEIVAQNFQPTNIVPIAFSPESPTDRPVSNVYIEPDD